MNKRFTVITFVSSDYTWVGLGDSRAPIKAFDSLNEARQEFYRRRKKKSFKNGYIFDAKTGDIILPGLQNPHYGPRFPHDCDVCEPVGMAGEFDTKEGPIDAYFCPLSAVGEGSILLRYGKEGFEYWSAPVDIIKENFIHNVRSLSQFAIKSVKVLEILENEGRIK